MLTSSNAFLWVFIQHLISFAVVILVVFVVGIAFVHCYYLCVLVCVFFFFNRFSLLLLLNCTFFCSFILYVYFGFVFSAFYSDNAWVFCCCCCCSYCVLYQWSRVLLCGFIAFICMQISNAKNSTGPSGSSRRARVRNKLSCLIFSRGSQPTKQSAWGLYRVSKCVCVAEGRSGVCLVPGERQPLIERRTQSTLNVAAGTKRLTNTICS